MELVGYARLFGVDSKKRFKEISVICLDEDVGSEVIYSPEGDQVKKVKDAYFLYYENAFPMVSVDSKGLVIHGNYNLGHVLPFKWPWELKDIEMKSLPWQITEYLMILMGYIIKSIKKIYGK